MRSMISLICSAVYFGQSSAFDMAHLPCAPTRPNMRLPSRAGAVWSKLLTQAPGSGPAASAVGPSPRGVQCFTGPAIGVFFGARVTRQPQTTNAIRTATKSPSSRLSTMLFSALGRSASVSAAGTPSPFASTTRQQCCGSGRFHGMWPVKALARFAAEVAQPFVLEVTRGHCLCANLSTQAVLC